MPDRLPTLRSPEQLLEIGLGRSRVVMVNEAHDAQTRCIRTREVGRSMLPVAQELGVRHLAMEALWNRSFVAEANTTRLLPEADGYLSQPEMRELIQGALDLGWTLIAYEADMLSLPKSDLLTERTRRWRQAEQGRQLAEALPEGPMLVWCGWGHHSKVNLPGFKSMASHFQELTGIEPFSIDQTISIDSERRQTTNWLERFAPQLKTFGGTAGFLLEDAPAGWGRREVDSFIFSLDNDFE